MKTPWLSALLLSTFAWTAFGQVDVQPSRTRLAENETLVLTITSDAPGFPDLGELERDFAILNRGMSTSSRTINGSTTRSARLTLTLMPRHSGDLTIPAVQFGEQASQPIRIQVTTNDTGPGATGVAPGTGQPGMAPPWFSGQTPGMGPGLNDWMNPQGFEEPGTSRNWTGSGLGPLEPVPDAPVLSARPESSPRSFDRSGTAGYWPWLTAIAAAGWLATSLLLLRQRNRERRRPEQVPVAAARAPTTKQPPRSKAEIEDDVQQAYTRADRYAARAALLQWGEVVWAADPPTNLSRLAARCPPELQRYILRLEEAIYSPSEEATWSRQPVREQLRLYRAAHPEDAGAAPGLETADP